MAMEAALSYAVFVGMRLGLNVVLAGDATVWDVAWGRLETLDPAYGDSERPAITIN